MDTPELNGTPPLRSWFAAFDDPSETYPIDTVVYRGRGGGLLDVQHDVEALRATPPAVWKARFEARFGAGALPDASGVWGKREWVLPELDPGDITSLGEGRSPLLEAPRFAEACGLSEVWVKQCGTTHTGSFKDLGMTVLVSAVRRMRRLGRPIEAIACASTGDTSAALAAYGARAGIPTVVLLPRGKVSTAQLLQPLCNGAQVLALDTDFDGCMRIVQGLASDGLVYLANSMNPLRLEGQKTAALEIAHQLGWQVPDVLVVPGGNLGNVYAFGRGFQLLRDVGLVDRVPRLVCAQAQAANPLYRAFQTGFERFEPIVAGDTQATAIRIGDPVSVHRAIRILSETSGLVEEATEDELADAVAAADREGFYTDPHTGVALAALRKLAARGAIGRGERVVVVSTAHGLKFTETKVAYHEDALAGVTARLRNAPEALPADPVAVRDAIRRRADAAR